MAIPQWVNNVLCHSSEGIFTQNNQDLYPSFEIENDWFDVTATSPRDQWVDIWICVHLLSTASFETNFRDISINKIQLKMLAWKVGHFSPVLYVLIIIYNCSSELQLGCYGLYLCEVLYKLQCFLVTFHIYYGSNLTQRVPSCWKNNSWIVEEKTNVEERFSGQGTLRWKHWGALSTFCLDGETTHAFKIYVKLEQNADILAVAFPIFIFLNEYIYKYWNHFH